jgi:hypothetical protein
MANDSSGEKFAIRKATRRATPQLLAIWGPTFSGKTYSALLVAAGLVKPGQKVGFVDTENGRGSAFADDEHLAKVLPQGYDVIEIDPPFHPKRYIAAIHQFENEGYSLVITDSASHAWSGEGGALDMKEKDKGWANAKLWNKRLLAAYCYSPIHHVVCLRAQEKTKIVGSGRDQQYIPLGVMPICEKTFPFDLGLAFSVEGEIEGRPATHLATPVKWPRVMNPLFADWRPQLLTPEIGRKIQQWNESGVLEDPTERLQKRAHAAAEEGVESYRAFFTSLTAAQKQSLKPHHEANKAAAEQVDKAIPAFGSEHNHVEWPDSFDGPTLRWNGELYEFNDESGNYKKVEVAHA